jgi:hypothetical protein
MKQVEANTKESFVASEDRKDWRGSWLESGDRPDYARFVNFNPDDGLVNLDASFPEDRYVNLGVARLLRV